MVIKNLEYLEIIKLTEEQMENVEGGRGLEYLLFSNDPNDGYQSPYEQALSFWSGILGACGIGKRC